MRFYCTPKKKLFRAIKIQVSSIFEIEFPIFILKGYFFLLLYNLFRARICVVYIEKF